MATRSKIGILKSDGKVDAIYCHWDGYPEYNGAILVGNYNDESIIRKLISFGDLSSLRPTLEYTESYYSLREEECPKKTYDNIKAYEEAYGDCWDEYNYIFKDNEWFVYFENMFGEKLWQKVIDLLKKSKEEQLYQVGN